MTNEEQSLSTEQKELVAVGASIGAGCRPCVIERHLRAAAGLGASRSQLEQAIDAAHTVQENAARIHLREAERLLDTVAPAGTLGTADGEVERGCGCGADAERQQTPTDNETREDEAPEPVAAVGRESADCHSMAAHFGSRDVFDAIASCRRMFEQFVGVSASAETKAPVATTAAGS